MFEGDTWCIGSLSQRYLHMESVHQRLPKGNDNAILARKVDWTIQIALHALSGQAPSEPLIAPLSQWLLRPFSLI